MTPEEILDIIIKAVAPGSLTALRVGIIQETLDGKGYCQMEEALHHSSTYIKDEGALTWGIISKALGTKVTKLNLRDVVTQYMHNLSTSSHPKYVDWGEAPDTSDFCGRTAQLATLMQWVEQDHCRLVAIAGMVGSGKTTLATHFAKNLADTGNFEVVVWRSLNQAPPYADFIRELLDAIAPGQSPGLQPDAMMRLLLEDLRSHRCLLILDSVETVMQGGELVGNYRPGYEDYALLWQHLGEVQHQSTILLTSREIPPEIAILSESRALVRLQKLEPLSIEEGERILAVKRLLPAAQPQAQGLIERYQGSPQMLLIAAMLSKKLSFNTDILLPRDIRQLLAKQLNRLGNLEVRVMFCLNKHPQPITLAQLETDLLPSISPVQLQDALVSLDRRSLVDTVNPPSAQPSRLRNLDCLSYTLQPVVREYIQQGLLHQ